MEAPTVLTTIHSPPNLDDLVPLAEHQSRTPATFFGGSPVLHHHAVAARALVPAEQRRSLPVFRSAAPASGGDDDDLVEQTVDVFVTSTAFTLFSADAACGVSIPYPLIGIHAVKTLPGPPATQAVYMQLDLADGGPDDETYDTVELTLVPPPSSSAADLFAAISACAELHPDSAASDDASDDGGYDDRVVFEPVDGYEGVLRGSADGAALPPPLPGSSGWITADNVADFFDADGNWIGGGDEEGGVSGELGEGAGRVRGRDEVDGTVGNSGASNGHGEDAESKRQRTD